MGVIAAEEVGIDRIDVDVVVVDEQCGTAVAVLTAGVVGVEERPGRCLDELGIFGLGGDRLEPERCD